MNTTDTTTTRPLAERITQGPYEIDAPFEGLPETICRIYGDGEFCIGHFNHEPDAELITEAFNVTHETGRTPRQLADERAELIAALRNILNAPGEGHVTPSEPDSFETQCRNATQLLNQLNQ